MKSALILLVACAHPPATSWQEREGAAQPHATRPSTGEAPTTLDPAKLDSYDEAQLAELLARLGDRAPAAKVALRAARLAHHRGDDAEARSLLARAATAADAGSLDDAGPAGVGSRAEGRGGPSDSKALVAELAPAQAAVDPALIAVLLPLTGRFSGLGAELRIAIELAPLDGAKLMFLDTRGDPDGAAAAVALAVQRGAAAILGPVGEREAVAAARAATARNIAIALLAPQDGADPAAGVFRLVSSSADEARAVARIAKADNFPTVAVFAPRDDVSADQADAFVAESKRLGLEVSARGSYDPTGGDLEPDVRRFLGAEHVVTHDKKYGLDRFEPDIAYTLLYIPDRYDRAAIVAAFLPYYNVELRSQDFPDPHMLLRKHHNHMPQIVQLVGSSGWHHPSLPIRGGSALQGALIVDFFAGDLGGDTGTQFAAAFQQRINRPPSSAAAQAHDAALIVLAARKLAANATDPRAALRTALSRARLDDGACGAAAMDVDGELERAAFTLEVSGDQLVPAP